MHRWKQRVWSWAGITALVSGCAAHVPPPRELIDARQAYQHASTSPSVQQEHPQALREAWQALVEAEREYDRKNTSPAARSLAYVALRKAQLAEAQASISVAERQRALAAQSLAQVQEAERRRAEAELRSAQQQLQEAQRLRDEAARLADARRLEAEAVQLQAEARRQQERAERLNLEEQQRQQLAQTQAQVETERRAREEAERRATEQLEAERRARAEAERHATEALARLEREGEVGVREDARGTVLTLSGSVLFASGESELLPSARSRLSEVADALKQSDNAITIEGHTDSLGPEAYNEELSLRRAEQVRGFLLSRGVPPERVSVRGLGEYRPVASNSTPEGRANNRRVEIVLQRLPSQDSGRTGVGGSGTQDEPH
ncbi:OmpA family protein [Hyalangium minutum]|uniref:Flagellar motor rotation protein MotB n=1 Tax=Hyalangium minutum TaxID=394096 RepID=A0A085WKH3_9BACT|nr:OmpA family protein [Hyalangium minutum]KFE68186.1 Flagellar motor rotation protein MotB [Hyalangium minutum]